VNSNFPEGGGGGGGGGDTQVAAAVVVGMGDYKSLKEGIERREKWVQSLAEYMHGIAHATDVVRVSLFFPVLKPPPLTIYYLFFFTDTHFPSNFVIILYFLGKNHRPPITPVHPHLHQTTPATIHQPPPKQ
jgi:hypothetical protein